MQRVPRRHAAAPRPCTDVSRRPRVRARGFERGAPGRARQKCYTRRLERAGDQTLPTSATSRASGPAQQRWWHATSSSRRPFIHLLFIISVSFLVQPAAAGLPGQVAAFPAILRCCHYKKVDLPRVGRSAPFGSGAGGLRAIMPHAASGAVAAYSSPGRNSPQSHSCSQGPFCAVQAGAVIKVATTLH